MIRIASILILCLVSEMAFASCFGQRFTLSEILANCSDEHSIFTCKIHETYFDQGGGYTSIAIIKDVIRGAPLDTVRIVTGGNSTRGGVKIKPGTNWLIISPKRDDLYYTATICHNLSKPLSEEDVGCGYKQKIYGEDFLKVIEEFYTLKREEFSGIHKFYIQDSIIAEGTFRQGVPHGKWRHFDYSRDLEKQQLLFEMEYTNGIPDGTTVRYIRGSHPLIIESEMRTENGKFVSRKIYDNKFYKYTYPEDGIQSISYYRVNEQGDTISISNSLNHYSLNEQNFYAEYKHGQYYNTIDSSGHNPLCKGLYFRGARVGKWEYYNKKGEIIKQETYEYPESTSNDFVIYQADGSLAISGKLIENIAVGVVKYYFDNHLGSEAYYDLEGQLQSITRYYKNGWIKVTPYKSMKRHGTEFLFSKSGKLLEISNYNSNIKEGIHIKYTEGGDVTYESYFNKGIETTIFRSDGNAPIVDGFSNGYNIQYNHKTGAKMHEGKIWMGYRTGEYLSLIHI